MNFLTRYHCIMYNVIRITLRAEREKKCEDKETWVSLLIMQAYSLGIHPSSAQIRFFIKRNNKILHKYRHFIRNNLIAYLSVDKYVRKYILCMYILGKLGGIHKRLYYFAGKLISNYRCILKSLHAGR